jgi:hypothetical protein
MRGAAARAARAAQDVRRWQMAQNAGVFFKHAFANWQCGEDGAKVTMSLSKMCLSAPIFLKRQGRNRPKDPVLDSLVFWKKPSEIGFSPNGTQEILFRLEEVTLLLLEDTGTTHVVVNIGFDNLRRGQRSLHWEEEETMESCTINNGKRGDIVVLKHKQDFWEDSNEGFFKNVSIFVRDGFDNALIDAEVSVKARVMTRLLEEEDRRPSARNRMPLSKMCCSLTTDITVRGLNGRDIPDALLPGMERGSVCFWRDPKTVGFCHETHVLLSKVNTLTVVLLEDLNHNVQFSLEPEEMASVAPRSAPENAASNWDYSEKTFCPSFTAPVVGKRGDIINVRSSRLNAKFVEHSKSATNFWFLSLVARDSSWDKRRLGMEIIAKVSFKSQLRNA